MTHASFEHYLVKDGTMKAGAAMRSSEVESLKQAGQLALTKWLSPPGTSQRPEGDPVVQVQLFHLEKPDRFAYLAVYTFQGRIGMQAHNHTVVVSGATLPEISRAMAELEIGLR